MRFDRNRFYENLRAWRGALSPQQVKGFNFILDSAERDPHLKHVSWLAYMMATAWHETAFTMQPIHEYGGRAYFIRNYGGHTRKGRELGNDTPEEGADYAGQGFVQLTGESNYEKAEVALWREYPEIVKEFELRTGKRFDLTVGDQPDDKGDTANAQDPAIAYAIMSYGMRVGLFTGRKLSQYFNSVEEDAFNARKIINGLDHADAIAKYYKQFKTILQSALIRETTPENVGAVIDAQRTDSPVATPPSLGSEQNNPPENNQAKPVENPSAEQPASNFDNVMGSLDAYGNKLERVDGTVSKVSSSSLFSYGSKMVMAVGAFGVGFVKDNWEWLVVGAVIIIVAGYLWNESKRRANERTLALLNQKTSG